MASQNNTKSFSYNVSQLLRSLLDQTKAIERVMNEADEAVKNMNRDKQLVVDSGDVSQSAKGNEIIRNNFGELVGWLDMDEQSLPIRCAPRRTRRLTAAWRRVKRVVSGACCIRR